MKDIAECINANINEGRSDWEFQRDFWSGRNIQLPVSKDCKWFQIAWEPQTIMPLTEDDLVTIFEEEFNDAYTADKLRKLKVGEVYNDSGLNIFVRIA